MLAAERLPFGRSSAQEVKMSDRPLRNGSWLGSTESGRRRLPQNHYSGARCAVSSDGQQFLGRNLAVVCSPHAFSWDLGNVLLRNLAEILGMEGQLGTRQCTSRAGLTPIGVTVSGREVWARTPPASARCGSIHVCELGALCGGNVAAVSSLRIDCFYAYPSLV